MNNIFTIFSEIQSTTKKTEKTAILTHNKDNEDFKTTLRWLLNPFVVTGISDKKLHKDVSSYQNAPLSQISWTNVMDYLAENNTGRDKDIAFIQDFLLVANTEERAWYEQLITKSLKLGIDAKTVNSVYGKGFIPTFDVMLANKYFEHPDKVVGDFTITEKLDGIRCVALVDGKGNVRFFSRQGQEFTGLVDIEADIKNMGVTGGMFDGELVLVDCENVNSKDNYKETVKIVRKDGDKHGVKYLIFDTLTLTEFERQECITSYAVRRNMLDTYIKSGTYAQVLPVLYSGNDTDKIAEWLKWARDNNREGVMTNLNNGMYEFKRTNQLLKVKVMQDADLLITGVYEGTGRNAGKLGGVNLEFEYNGKLYPCNCGSGFSDEERVKYWNNPDLLIEKIATIQYFEITENADGGFGLRFPVWLGRIREDKTEISMN